MSTDNQCIQVRSDGWQKSANQRWLIQTEIESNWTQLINGLISELTKELTQWKMEQ